MFLTVNICTYYVRMCTYMNNLKKGGRGKADRRCKKLQRQGVRIPRNAADFAVRRSEDG